MKSRTLILAILLVLFTFPALIQAQSGAKISLRNLDVGQFPLIQAVVDARDNEGNFLFGLQSDDFTISENGQLQAISQLRLTEIPVRLSIVINPSEAFSIRDAQGFNRYDYVRESLSAWASELTDEVSLSLISQAGLEIPFTEASSWLNQFQSYSPDFSIITPNLQALSSALLLSAQPGEQAEVASAILLVSAAPSSASLAGLEEFLTSAENLGLAIFVWLVDSSARFDLDEAVALQNLALQSGGSFYGFSGTEGLPDPQEYLADLGNIYRLQYFSDLRESGQHELQLSLNTEELTLSSAPINIDISLENPKAIFLSPPAFIRREASEEEADLLAPFSQVIEIIVEFPDGFERQLLRTTLRANGEIVAENRSAPFTRFSWDLSDYHSNQSVILQVEIEDELGLVGSSIDLPVEISIAGTPENVAGAVIRNVPQFVLVMALLLGGAVFVFMVLSGRISPPSLFSGSIDEHEQDQNQDDPLLDMPSSIADMAQPFGEKRRRIPASEAQAIADFKESDLAPAYLLPLSAEGHPQMSAMFVLEGKQHIFGSDDKESAFTVIDASVDAQHAVIRRNSEGAFEIADLGSDAGTWVNYAPTSEAGAGLLNGDLIHIGKAAFRFFLEKPSGRAFKERKK